jgi:uncharacterized protein
MIFLDTSAIYALADQKDEYYAQARESFGSILSQGGQFMLHNYILVESVALIQRRLGLEPAKKLLHDAGWFRVVWVDSSLHELASDYFQKHATRNISFVDCISFVLMKQEHIREAFAFDEDFEKAGFQLYLPS